MWQPTSRRLSVTVSGSFTRAIAEVRGAVADFLAAGARVLSPTDPRPVDVFDDFVFVASDRLRTVRILQERHFAAIERSSLLWLCAPGGYLGASAAAEVHHANAHGVPVFCDEVPSSLYWRQVVTPVVGGAAEALRRVATPRLDLPGSEPSWLLEPDAAAEAVHRDTEAAHRLLISRGSHQADDPYLRSLLRRLNRT